MIRKNIAASESAFIYILGLCGGTALSTMLSYLLPMELKIQGLVWINYLIPQIAFLLVVFGYSWMRHVDIKSVAKIRVHKNLKQTALLPFVSIAVIILFMPLSHLFQSLLGVMGYSLGGVYLPPVDNAGTYFLSLLVMAVLPALGEEFLMRGALMSGLSTRGTWFGILMSSLLFSLMHQNPLQTVHQFGLGIVLCIVLLITRSIWPCVFIHFFNNFVSVTMSAYIPEIDRIFVSLGNYIYLTDVIAIVVGFILVAVLLYMFYRAGEKKRDGFHASTDGVFDEFTVYATAEVKSANRKSKFRASLFYDTFKFVGSLFTLRGWRAVSRELNSKNDVPYLGKAQPMFNVWLAVGFAVFYWLIILIMGFI